MPYITKQEREAYDIYGLDNLSIYTPGQLNYLFTQLINNYLNLNTSYQTINDCIGALEGCKFELYRRLAANYEDEKIKENGDVY